MKDVTIDFPIVGWGSVTIQVDDDCSTQDLLDDILDGNVDIIWDGKTAEQLIPVFDIRDFVRNELGQSEIPAEITVVD